jgi:succinate dehydrogenase / fumarate reductase membrane anchor subunit
MTKPTESYILQRVTGAVMAPLSIYLLFWVIPAIGGILSGNEDKYYHSIDKIFGSIQSLTCLVIFIICSMYHSILGMRSIMNDYISCDSMKKVLNYLLVGGALGVTVFVFTLALDLHSKVNSFEYHKQIKN